MRALALLVVLALAGIARADGFVVVVHARSQAQLDRETIAEAFLKKRTRWSDDTPILPVDLARGSPVRKRFSSAILERSVDAVRTYWNQLVFSGRGVPPPELDGDRAVVQYVATHPGAIGYVSPDADVHEVKVVKVE